MLTSNKTTFASTDWFPEIMQNFRCIHICNNFYLEIWTRIPKQVFICHEGVRILMCNISYIIVISDQTSSVQ